MKFLEALHQCIMIPKNIFSVSKIQKELYLQKKYERKVSNG